LLGSIRIGSVFGIQVRVHWLFLALVAFLMFLTARKGGDPLETLALITTLFGVVFLHELGHSLVARHFGIRVLDITFWPLGGMARMNEIPESFKIEGMIAIAGPAVNFVLAFLAAPILMWSVVTAPSDVAETVYRASGFFVGINLLLGVFNLVPAFPMDGGRVLRAFLGRKGDWVGATATAVKVGKVFAVMMVVFGLMPGTFSFLPLIGLFVWFAGSRELQAVRMRHRAPWVNPFGGTFPFGGPSEPVARPAEVERTAHTAPASADPSGARRPTRPEVDPGPPRGRGAFTPEEIERLERYRGPMR
jgi:Zn-dependent protease